MFTTSRLALRPLTNEDWDLLFALDAHPEVMRFINGGHGSTRDEVVETIRGSLGHRWLAFEHATGDFVGWFALKPSPGASERELGYRLRRDVWGTGYATEGCRVLIDHAFNDLTADRVWAQTMTVNIRSRRVLERCGLRFVRAFHLDGVEPIEGSELGDVEYEILRSLWAPTTTGAEGCHR